jgi:hypothetical protein
VLPAPVQERVRVVRIAVLGRWRRRRPTGSVVVPGSGPVVVLTGLGVPWDRMSEIIEERHTHDERLVVVTDQPVMQIARDAAAIVEYVPRRPGDPRVHDLVEARLAEIRRVYAASRIEEVDEC